MISNIVLFIISILTLISCVKKLKNKKMGEISYEKDPYHFILFLTFFFWMSFFMMTASVILLTKNFIDYSFLFHFNNFLVYSFTIPFILFLISTANIAIVTGKLYWKGGLCERKHNPIIFNIAVTVCYLFSIFLILIFFK